MSNIRDTNLKVTKALPAAAATNTSDSIDLLDKSPGLKLRNAEIEVALPATPALVDAKTITLAIHDSADNSSFAAIPTLASVVATGASSAGAAAITRKFKLPESARRYIRLSQTVETGGGSNIAVSSTLSVVY
jgi:hypothetical protein